MVMLLQNCNIEYSLARASNQKQESAEKSQLNQFCQLELDALVGIQVLEEKHRTAFHSVFYGSSAQVFHEMPC